MTESLHNNEDYNYIVVGSGIAALAFIDRTLSLDPRARILCLERGGDDIKAYHEHLREASRLRAGDHSRQSDVNPSECSWRLTELTASSEQLNQCAGTCFLFGGRSNYWHGWCMQPRSWQLRDFPPFMLRATEHPKFWSDAHRLLDIRSVESLTDIFHVDIQGIVDERLSRVAKDTSNITDVQPALFAHGGSDPGHFARFSVPERLKALASSNRQQESQIFDIRTKCTVSRLVVDSISGHVCSLETSQGTLHLPTQKTQIILCAGPIPNATLLLDSLPDAHMRVGRHFGGHFRSHVFAKIPHDAFVNRDQAFNKRKRWGVATKVITGVDKPTGLQFHIQLSVFSCPQYEGRYHDIVAELPRYGTAPVEQHIKDLGEDLLVVCTGLGELSSNNEHAWLRRSSPSDETGTHVDLQFTLTEDDHHLWATMDSAAFKLIECLSLDEKQIRYWSGSESAWVSSKPSASERRSPVLVHEACVTPAGHESDCNTVDESYEVYGCNNVYVTGAGLFPTAGSWNPTLAICGFAQHLAELLWTAKQVNTSSV